jgi:hypothetical protein
MSFRQPNLASFFGMLVVFPTLGALALLVAGRDQPIPLKVIPWVILIALVELLPVATWGGVTVSVGYPLVMAVAFTFSPEVAALVAVVSASDPREFRGEVTLLRALVNRSCIALAVLAASWVFHAVSSVRAPVLQMFSAALLAIIVDYAINLGLVTVGVCLIYRFRPLRVAKELLGRGQEFLVSYLGLGALGASLARLYTVPGFGLWSVLTVLAPLLFARQMFLRSQALEEAHKELKDREQVLRTLSNAMAEERADERQKIAAYLHDDLAQVLEAHRIDVKKTVTVGLAAVGLLRGLWRLRGGLRDVRLRGGRCLGHGVSSRGSAVSGSVLSVRSGGMSGSVLSTSGRSSSPGSAGRVRAARSPVPKSCTSNHAG